MGQITIRNLDDAVLDGLRRRAAAAGRSMEEEARRVLAAAVGIDRPAVFDQMEAFRNRLGARGGEPAEQLIREYRRKRGGGR